MIKVIKNAYVYAPYKLGKKDIVIVGDKIEGIYENIDVPKNFLNIEIIEGDSFFVVPGFIDSHVHIIGGGGEGGFKSRTSEINLSTIIKAGITTLVGCIGTDGVCRSMNALVAKANGLTEEGVTCYCYTGSYDIQVKAITESVKMDIMLIDKIIGTGEIALSDHRSSQGTFHEFVALVANSRVGGILSGKSGVVNIHLGNGKRKMDYLFRLLDETEIPAIQVLPTHINRNKELFKEGLKYTKKGGFIDFTTSSDPKYLESDEIEAGKALKLALDNNIDINKITFSSDGNGSSPIFDDYGKLIGMGVCSVNSLYREVKEAIKLGVPIEKALMVVTENVANILKLSKKGKIECGNDADLVFINKETLDIDTVISKGKVMMRNKKVIIKGTFEFL